MYTKTNNHHNMAPTTTTNNNNKYNITPTTYSSRWIPKVEEAEDKKKRSGWTEVTSKHTSKRHYNNKTENDPFAGMKPCVNYEQEIERLKQLVPKVISQPKTTSFNNNNQYSRSNSPDTTHSSDSEISLPESVITEQEKARFLAFVRSWTGDYKNRHLDDQLMDNSSLWADPSPWNYHPTASTAVHHLSHSQSVQNSYNHWQNQSPIINRHGQLPIGMGRKKY